MNKTINILISSIVAILSSTVISAAPLMLSQEKASNLKTSGLAPITVSTNFEITDANLIVLSDKHADLTLLKKGFILVPKKSNYSATIVLTARNGSIYPVNMKGGGIKTVFRMEDPLQSVNKNVKKFNFESGKMAQDARNMIKTVLLDKPLSGFEKTNAYQKVTNREYSLERIERHIGGKYIVDRWSLKNTSNTPLYFVEEDFYTEGILAVAIEKNRILKSEEIFLLTILNKNSIYEQEKRTQK